MAKYYEYNGVKFKVEDSERKGKQLVATFKDGKEIHFGDKKMPEFVGTKRGDNYCARSSGISNKGIRNANTLSRKILWNCKGKKSEDSKRKSGISLISKEDFYE
jgi:hypothetical protein